MPRKEVDSFLIAGIMAPPEYRITKIATPNCLNNHAMFGTLFGKRGLIEKFDTYECHAMDQDDEGGDTKKEQLLLFHDVVIGSNLCGHDGIVHGGITSFLFDEVVGWGHRLVMRRRQQKGKNADDDTVDLGRDGTLPQGVSANLNIDFRVPLRVNTLVRIKTYLVRTHGRKVFLRVTLESANDQYPPILYAEAASIMVTLKSRL